MRRLTSCFRSDAADATLPSRAHASTHISAHVAFWGRYASPEKLFQLWDKLQRKYGEQAKPPLWFDMKPPPSFKPKINARITKEEFERRWQEDEAQLQEVKATLKAKLNKTAAPDLSDKAWARPKKIITPEEYYDGTKGRPERPSFTPKLGPDFNKGISR